MLNKNAKDITRKLSPGRGLLSPNTKVYDKQRGTVSISNIDIGDFVKDAYNTYTEVLGIYTDGSEKVPRSGPNSSAWIWNSELELWDHPEEPQYETDGLGCHLITKSGIFMIEGEKFVRDFTEIGADRIHETYSFVKDFSMHW
jgi:hypothetical protein